MLEDFHYVLVFIALLGSGLIAGVFFAFSTFVMKALSRLSSAEGIAAMPSINVTVLNPWLLGVHLGTAVVCIILLVWSVIEFGNIGSGYLMTGSVFYFIGCFMATGVFNVLRNEVLAKLDASAETSQRVWRNYIDEWTFWNHVRAMASLFASACFAIGFVCIKQLT